MSHRARGGSTGKEGPQRTVSKAPAPNPSSSSSEFEAPKSRRAQHTSAVNNGTDVSASAQPIAGNAHALPPTPAPGTPSLSDTSREVVAVANTDAFGATFTKQAEPSPPDSDAPAPSFSTPTSRALVSDSDSSPSRPSFVTVAPNSYARALAIRRSRAGLTASSATSADSESDAMIAPSIMQLPRNLGPSHHQKTFFVAIRRPPPTGDRASVTHILDPGKLLHAELADFLHDHFPCKFLESCWDSGALMAVDPYPMDDAPNHILRIIYAITLVWPKSSLSSEDAETLISRVCAGDPGCPHSRPRACDISYRAMDDEHSRHTVQLDASIAFARSPADLYPFATKPPDNVVVLSVTFSFLCPQKVYDKKLATLATRIYSRKLKPEELATLFPRVAVLPNPGSSTIGRITNTFNARFGFSSEDDAPARHAFMQMCLIHLEHKQKLLDADPDRTTRISSASFSYITDKNPKARKPPHWFATCLQEAQALLDSRLAALQPQASAETNEAKQSATQPSGDGAAQDASAAVHDPPSAEHGSPAPTESVTITIASTPYHFKRSDCGHLLSIGDGMEATSVQHCSLALCLGIALGVPPADIATHFNCRASQLRHTERLLHDDPANAAQWQAFLEQQCKPSYSNLAFSFPTPDGSSNSAALYELGAPLHPHHLALLAPTEVRQRMLFFFRGLQADADGKLSLTASNKQMGTCVEYIPPSFLGHRGVQPAGTPLPPLFFAFIDGHYSLLTCLTDPFTAVEHIIRKIPRDRYFLYIPPQERDILVTPFVKLVGLDAPCATPRALGDAYDACMAALTSTSTHEGPAHDKVAQQHQQHAAATVASSVSLLNSASRPGSPAPGSASDSAPLDLLTSHEAPVTPPRLSPSKKQNSLPTPDRSRSQPSSPSIELQTSQLSIHTPSHGTSTQASNVSNIGVHSPSASVVSSISNLSNVDLEDYVAMQGRALESKYAARIGVVGDCSSDTTSEATPVSWRSSISSSTSRPPSLYSNGSLHSHAIPSNHDVPRCQCRRSMRFFCFHEDNHNCDGAECAHPRIPPKSYAWHCADCDIDLCTTCFPIDFTPENSFADSQSSISLPDTLPSDAAPRSQVGADAAASGRGHNA